MASFTTPLKKDFTSIKRQLQTTIKHATSIYNSGDAIGALRVYTKTAESYKHIDPRLLQALASQQYCEDATDAWAIILRGFLTDLLTTNNASANPVAINRIIADGEHNWMQNRHGICLVKYVSYFQNRQRFRTSTALEDHVLLDVKRHHVLDRVKARAFILLYAMKRIIQAPAPPPPHPDRFAIFLKPIDLNIKSKDVQKVNAINSKWGGLHIALCSFAPKKGERTSDWKEHNCSSMKHAVIAIADAVRQSIKDVGKSRFSLVDEFSRLDTNCLPLQISEKTGVGMLLIAPLKSSRSFRQKGVSTTSAAPKFKTLNAICQAAATAQLYRARRPEQLHINLGKAWADEKHANEIRSSVLKCVRWEIVVVKCSSDGCDRDKLKVTDVVERRELSW